MPDAARPLALFTAGPPGAGKSELVDALLPRYDLASLDSDTITAAFAARRPERPFWTARPLALRLLDRWQGVLIGARVPLVVNTTAADLGFVLALRDRLTAHGFRPAMVFVAATAEHCRARNAARPHPRPAPVLEDKLRACAANRARLERCFRDFRSIANDMGREGFGRVVQEDIWPWLDALGTPRRGM